MKKMVLTAAFACAALVMPGLAMAEDAMSSHDATGHAMMATMLCRPAMAKETPTAMMLDKKTMMVCKTIPAGMMKAKNGGPDLSHALSADQVDAAWRKYVGSMIMMPQTGGG